MTARTAKSSATLGNELGIKLLQSVREMKARDFACATEVQANEVLQARRSTGLSQS